MRKCDEESNPNSYWNKAVPGEEVFVLLGRDPAAATVLRFWAEVRVRLGCNRYGDTQTADAIAMAERLERIRR